MWARVQGLRRQKWFELAWWKSMTHHIFPVLTCSTWGLQKIHILITQINKVKSNWRWLHTSVYIYPWRYWWATSSRLVGDGTKILTSNFDCDERLKRINILRNLNCTSLLHALESNKTVNPETDDGTIFSACAIADMVGERISCRVFFS